MTHIRARHLSSGSVSGCHFSLQKQGQRALLWRVLHFSHNYIAMQEEKIRQKVIAECSGRQRQRKGLCLITEALVEVQRRDGPVCFFVCMCFNITIVLCFAPSPFLRNCRMERASATSSPSGLWARSRGHEPLSPHPAWHVTSSATTPSHLSRLLMWKWGRTTTEGRGPSAL